jgi:hypothetical protein
MTRLNKWQNYFSHTTQANLDSVSFGDACTPEKTLLLLLQEGRDTWL